MVYNNVEDIKRNLMLESENQTVSDTDIEKYIEDANEEMIAEIGRTMEAESFYVEEQNPTVVPFFNIQEIKEIKVKTQGYFTDSTTTLTTDDYEIIYGGDAIDIKESADVNYGDTVFVYYIPKNYVLLEKAITINNLLERLNPFAGENINPAYASWREKVKNYKKILKSNFGTGIYSPNH